MVAPVGSLRDLQQLLEEPDSSDIFERRSFPFYGVLMYTPTNGLNRLLHEYVVSHYQLFNAQTGPNWLVAVLEDIRREHSIEKFKPQDVYAIARYLGVRVDDIPAIVFFTEPKERNETLVLRLSDILPEASKTDDKDLTELFGKLAATIDDICQRGVPVDDRLKSLREGLNSEWPKDSVWGKRISSGVEWVKASAPAAGTVLGAINNIANLLTAAGF